MLKHCLEVVFSGAEGQNRTVDTSLFRAVLYQLSYLGTYRERGLVWKAMDNTAEAVIGSRLIESAR